MSKHENFLPLLSAQIFLEFPKLMYYTYNFWLKTKKKPRENLKFHKILSYSSYNDENLIWWFFFVFEYKGTEFS